MLCDLDGGCVGEDRVCEGAVLELNDARWTMSACLGRGAFGVVWEAIDAHTGVARALKTIDHEAFASFKMRFQSSLEHDTEYKMLVEVSHSNALRPFGSPGRSSEACLMLEMIDGYILLEQLLSRGPLPAVGTAALVRQLLAVVSHLHEKNIIHRDIKPENLMLLRRGGPVVKLIDFGLARRVLRGCVTVVGSSYYMAPEITDVSLRSSQCGYDCLADMWSLGITLYEAWCASPLVDESFPETLIAEPCYMFLTMSPIGLEAQVQT